VLPLTTAVTQVVMLRCGDATVAVPPTWSKSCAVPSGEIEQAYAGGGYPLGDRVLPFFWLGALLQTSPARRPRPSAAHGRWWWCAARQQRVACTSTKCWATRKWWSRTSGRSCRACPVWPA
jgi:chemotaxis protein histidine kinase CheA